MKRIDGCLINLFLTVFMIMTFPLVSLSQTIILSEDFESGVFPSTWSQYTLSSDGGWNYGDSATLSSQYYRIPEHGNFLSTNADACQCNKSSDYVITPYLDLSSFATIFMNFNAYFEGDKNWGQGAEFYAEKATVEISIDSGETWTVIDSLKGQRYQWADYELNLSAFKGYSSVLIAFHYDDNTDLSGYSGFGCAIDNVLIYEPVERDMSLVSLDNSQYSLSGNNTFYGKTRNIGASPVYSFDLNYAVNSGMPVTATISGDTILPFDYYNFTHAVPYNAIAGIDTIKFWISNVNGLGGDMISANDSAEKVISFVSAFVQRKILVEEFTSANCTGCSAVNAVINPLLDSNASKIAQIRYHGLDDIMYLYNTLDNDIRTSYYDIDAFPDVIADGLNSLNTQQNIDSLYNIPSFFNLQLSASFDDSLIYLDITSTSNADVISGNCILYVALVEDLQFQDPPGLNGETVFPKVLRKMFPNAGGISIGTPVLNQSDHFSFTCLNDTLFNAENLYAVAFLQDKHSKIVYQSAISKVVPTDTTGYAASDENFLILIYPQPASDILTIGPALSDYGFHVLLITDISGKTVFVKSLDNDNSISIDVSAFSQGYYLLSLQGESSFRKLIPIVH